MPLIFFMSSLLGFAQTPCDNGMAGSYPCNGYDLQSFIPFSTFNATSGNDSWGWTDPQDGSEYVLMGLDNGTVFIDISDPINPVYLGKLPTHTSSTIWRDVKVYNDYAFIVSEAGGHGMQVFDLTRLRNVTNPPETFSEDAHYNGFGSAHNIVINEETGFAYGVGTNSYNGGPHFINIQDPLNPIAAGGYGGSGYSHDAQVIIYNGPDSDHIGKEIYIGSNEDHVAIVDITDKANPQLIGSATYTNNAYTHQGWLSEDLNYFILGDELDEQNFGFNTKTVVFDFSDLDNPQFDFDYYGTTPAIDHNGYTKNNKYYLANYTAGMRVLDISDLDNQNMSEESFFDTYPSNDSANFAGAWNVYPYFGSGNIVISNYSGGGLFIVKSNEVDTTNPVAVCQNLVIELNENGNATLTAFEVDGGSSDNSGFYTVSINQSSFDCTNLGTNDVTLTVTDPSNNTNTCIAEITILDSIDPNAIGQNTTGDLLGTGTVTIPVANVNNNSTDNCSITNMTLTPDTFTSIGAYSAVFEVSDASGNSNSVTVEITVIDSGDAINPIANCQNISVQLDNNGEVTIDVTDVDNGSTDNVGIVTYELDNNTFTCDNLGNNTVNLTVFDTAGNSDSCSAIVTVQDDINPTIIGQNVTANLDGNPSVTVLAATVDNGSFDNCTIETLTLTPDTFTTIGNYNVILEGFDATGNSENITVEITIIDTVDNENPVAICQDLTAELDENGLVTVSANDADGGSSDNSGSFTLSLETTEFDCSNIGENNVILTVTDPSGNTDTCTTIITIEDNISPVLTCPDDQLIELGIDGTLTLLDYVANNEATAIDNCTENLIISQDPLAGTILGDGPHIISFETIDDEGNSATCSFIIDTPLLGVNNNQFSQGLSIYPNPSSIFVNINSKTELLEIINIFDISGKQILNLKNINSLSKIIDISNFSNGIYFLSINNKAIKKLVKN
jgi:choice-of-anchor B domain-containing protein